MILGSGNSAGEGARVVITGRDRKKLDSAIADIKASADSDIIGVVADAASAEGAAIIAKAERSVDILVNNLGIMRARPSATSATPIGAIYSTSM